jgi:tetratricopeptide (TPR) repeat protein
VKGNCHDALLQNGEAIACYSTCIALRPDFHWSWYNRGLAHLRQNHFPQARADFDEAIDRRADLPEVYVNRAAAFEGVGEFVKADDNLTQALQFGADRAQVLLMRAVVREKAGNPAGAKNDRDEGLRAKPASESGWIARGLARMEKDPAGALADFDAALRLNPLSFSALQNKAHVLGERLRQDRDAVEVLDRAVAFYPDNALPRAGRAVHLGRLGRREAALQDAQEALLLDTEAPNLYQVGSVYALTSKQKPDDRFRAFELVSKALKSGFGLDFVDQDTDLDPIRRYPEFRRLVEAAHAWQASPGSPKK